MSCLPDNKVPIVMVDQHRNLAVWIDLQKFGAFVLAGGEIEVLCFIAEPELFEYDCNFPVDAAIELVSNGTRWIGKG